MPGALPTYAVVTPVRDEADHFARTAESLISQTHRPRQWIVVDDGSTDGTRELAERYAAEHDWIEVIAADGSHERARGAPIVRAFQRGCAALAEQPEVVVKLDGDLYLPPHYFEWVAATFARDPRAGIVGGVALIPEDGRWVPERGNLLNVNGVAKAYRVACLEDIGGLRPSMGWDGIDEYGARARGWHVRVLTELTLLHYRPRGSKQKPLKARWEEGRGNAYMGYLPSWLLVRAAYRSFVERPPLLGGLVLLAGFLWARLRRVPQVDDPAARAELRAEQRARLAGLLRGRRQGEPDQSDGGGPAYWATGPGEP
ncbi:MAG: glycosyltransferase family 2 protein [Actinomycetota bacterium]|nr:glycosyltransferase family 2 protein [Actinomycetota bacterium]